MSDCGKKEEWKKVSVEEFRRLTHPDFKSINEEFEKERAQVLGTRMCIDGTYEILMKQKDRQK